MKLTKDLHRFCPGCGEEADGLEQVGEVFGFQIENDEIVPRSYCKKCRAKEQLQQLQPCESDKATATTGTNFVADIGWARASTWAKRIHTKKEVFIKYLIDLGYLTAISQDEGDSDYTNHSKGAEKIEAKGTIGPLRLTEKGRLHSAINNTRFKETLLWDYEAFVDVIRHRSQTATVSYHCPRCGYSLNDDPEFDHKAFAYRCHQCGKVYDYFTSKVVYNE